MPSERSIPCICGNTDCGVPYGYCHCRCGRKTTICHLTNTQFGRRAGWPTMWSAGHGKNSVPITLNEPPFLINGVRCRRVLLTQGQFAVVWESDFERVNSRKWQAQWNKCTQSFYAQRTELIDGKRICILMHRFVLGIAHDDPHHVDHENREHWTIVKII
jgi:hypothetical protein